LSYAGPEGYGHSMFCNMYLAGLISFVKLTGGKENISDDSLLMGFIDLQA
jgi:hypothetical protein